MEYDIDLEDLKSAFKRSRLLIVCKSCFALKPPIIVELGNTSVCSWCSKEKDDLLLLETRSNANSNDVEYFVIRKRESNPSNSIKECKKHLGLNWKQCPSGEKCKFAHNKIELHIWELESKFNIERNLLAKKFNSSETSGYSLLKGVFHCSFCSKNFLTGKNFSDHRDSLSHKHLMRVQESKGRLNWKHRPLPETEKFILCELMYGSSCPDGPHCSKAHSPAELEEWTYRLQIQKDKLQYASDTGLMSFVDRVLHEYNNTSSPATVMKSFIPGVKAAINFNTVQRIQKKKFEWILKIRCEDNKEKLNHAAFITRSQKNAFQICRCRRKRQSKPVSHLDFKVMLSDNYSLNLHDGEATYMVKFKTEDYGSYSSFLFLEFRNKPRPVLKIEFNVEVINALYYSISDVMKLTDVSRKPETLSWEEDRKIIRVEKPFAHDVDEALMKEYKSPYTALDYSALKHSFSSNVFDPKKLTPTNYVEEMHYFLYREEKTRSEKLSGVRSFCIALSSDYMSTRNGICFCPPNQLFAIFELPDRLSRDSEEGLLIFENCSKALIGKENKASEPAYEVLIEEKFMDHVVLLLSQKCVLDWQLVSGQVVDVEIQFQLDRERFCRCHFALDQLKENNRLRLVCPMFQARRELNKNTTNRDNLLNKTLDEDQRKVFAYLQSENHSAQGSPLFVVQGSFGTGKTYTISQCIKHLVETDKNAKILVCTHSNSAARIYIEANFQDVEQWKGKVIRILYHGRNIRTISELELQYCLRRNNQFRYPTAKDVASHKIFVTTFETSLVLGVRGTGLMGSFTHIFLDEVAQTMEAAAIIPLTLADAKTKVVIAGDHMQITEKIYCKHNRFNDSTFTLLERLYHIYSGSKTLNSHLVVLRNNYRSISPILKLIELLFYREGMLRPCTEAFRLYNLACVQFHDIEGSCKKNLLTGGYYNEAEAQKVTDVVDELLQTYPEQLQQTDVAVVAAYDDQVGLIRKLMRVKKMKNVYVERVRNIQGREFKVVVISCVHKRETRDGKEGENFGLLSNRNLLNTALTRTKLAIIAVGHAVTLWSLGKCHIMWREYIRTSAMLQGLFPSYRTVEDIMKETSLKNYSSLNPFAVEFVPGSSKRPVTPNSIQQDEEFSQHEETTQDLDDTIDEEETLPLKDDILDDIVKNVIGINPDKITIKVDKSGQEFPVEQNEDDAGDPLSNEKNIHSDFSLDHLNEFLRTQPNKYKRCIINMKNWNSAIAVVMDDDPDVEKIHINSKTNLGRSFDLDEVVVKKIKELESPDDPGKLLVYGKVIGILSRYKDPTERKFICVPDIQSPMFMCPVDKKITKFLIRGRHGMKTNNFKIPIFKLTDKGTVDKQPTYVDYDRYAITLDKSKHFVVRFVKWPTNSKYPIGYVSEEIRPKKFEKYYSIVHDVPSQKHEKSVLKEAEKLNNRTTDDQKRRDFSDLFVFTIDPEGSTDLDDAMSLQRCCDHDDCWKIGIHIADVASVVPPGSSVDEEARKRATSFYGGKLEKEKSRTVIHMLPPSLSSDKCSLLPDGKKRLTISLFIHSSKLPSLSGNQDLAANLPKPIPSYVKSRRQMTYLEAETEMRNVRRNGMDENKLLCGSDENNIGEQLIIIWRTMLRLRIKRIEFSTFYAQPEFDGFNQFCQDASAHMLIEEAMITYNACCSLYLHKKKCEFLLRTQDSPLAGESSEWMEKNSGSIVRSLHQQACLKSALGDNALKELLIRPLKQSTIPIIPYVWFKIQEALNSGDLNSALILFCCDSLQPAASSGHSGFFAIQSKGKIQTNKEVFNSRDPGVITHFSLRLPFYSWFTSPIRRYTDLQSQRLIIEICSTKQKDSNVLHISRHKETNLKELAKKLSQRKNDAKLYERDIQNFSFGLQLSNKQNYEVACVKEIAEGGVFVSFLDLRDLPKQSLFLRFSDLKLSSQEESSITWRLKYFDVNLSEQATQERIGHNNLTGTQVSSSEWNALLRSIKASIISREVIDSQSRFSAQIKQNFVSLLNSRRVKPTCPRSAGFGPCISEHCVKSKSCRDHLDGLSRLKIYHHRKITMSLDLGTPMLVQLYCGVKKGLCVPSLQLLSLAQDLDICLAHNSSPIETFAANVRPLIKSKFLNLEHYTKFWIPLSRMEAIYNAVRDNTNCIILQNVHVTFDQKNERVIGRFSLKREFVRKRLLRITTDDFLCIRVKCFEPSSSSKDSNDSKSISHKKAFTWILHAVVTESKNDGYDRHVSFSSCAPLAGASKIPDAVLAKSNQMRALVEIIQLGVSDRAINNSLRNIADPDSCYLPNLDIIEDLCLDQFSFDRKNSLINEIQNSVGIHIVPGMKYRLNEGQIEQIQKALGRKISMIQGPPGTGKSFVGAHLAYYFHLCNQLFQDGSKKILYCGPSNKSVDVVAEYLLDSKMKVLRLYGKIFEEEDYPNPLKSKSFNKETEKRPSKIISDISLHQMIRMPSNPFAAEIRKYDSKFRNSTEDITYGDYEKYKKLLVDAKYYEYERHDVIICTCASAAVMKNLLTSFEEKKKKKTFRFSQCIIDECGMCSEPETLAPIIASKAQQVVLIGDHQQLQPVIMSRRAREFGLGVSMFERLKNRAGMLTTQYRMDEMICDFPSRNFYEGRLQTHESVTERESRRSFRFCHPPDSPNTAVFCHVVGVEKANFSLDRGGESSYYNEEEAEAVLKVLLYFLRNKVLLSDVMILSPYSAQVTTIRNVIIKNRPDLKDVSVGTVTSSQGSERDFVILSTVRSRSEVGIEKETSNIYWRRKYIGFVTDYHQINVAITRAKSGLCIVGNLKVLEKDSETWEPLLDSYKERGSLVKVNDPTAPWN